MKTKSKNKCGQSCGCPTPIKKKHQNGKGDKPRPVNQNLYTKNYEEIEWKKR